MACSARVEAAGGEALQDLVEAELDFGARGGWGEGEGLVGEAAGATNLAMGWEGVDGGLAIGVVIVIVAEGLPAEGG